MPKIKDHLFLLMSNQRSALLMISIGMHGNKKWSSPRNLGVYEDVLNEEIIEWTESPQQAFEYCLRLNNKYELDGRGANAFAGIAWTFGNKKIFYKINQI